MFSLQKFRYSLTCHTRSQPVVQSHLTIAPSPSYRQLFAKVVVLLVSCPNVARWLQGHVIFSARQRRQVVAKATLALPHRRLFGNLITKVMLNFFPRGRSIVRWLKLLHCLIRTGGMFSTGYKRNVIWETHGRNVDDWLHE